MTHPILGQPEVLRVLFYPRRDYALAPIFTRAIVT